MVTSGETISRKVGKFVSCVTSLLNTRGPGERGKGGNKGALLNLQLAGEFTSGGAISRKVVRTKFLSCFTSGHKGGQGVQGEHKGDQWERWEARSNIGIDWSSGGGCLSNDDAETIASVWERGYQGSLLN